MNNMSSDFYLSIIEDERKAFGIRNETLKTAAVAVGRAYSPKALKNGSTYIDYNIPSNRCAYLYKYAALHTKLVSKSFLKMFKKKEAKKVLQSKKSIKICCLGGGPGTDVVGLFKALSLFPGFHQKVTEVTVLDICGGWRNSFAFIISGLTTGKVKGVPETFTDVSNFKSELIHVNLLQPLPDNIVEIISSADIISSVKFISVIFGNPSTCSALKVIGKTFKHDAVVLFVDNYQGDVCETVKDIWMESGLKTILGPLLEESVFLSRRDQELFGCSPSCFTKVSIIGMIKSLEANNYNVTPFEDFSSICESVLSLDSCFTESEISTDEDHTFNNNIKVNQFTQTYSNNKPVLTDIVSLTAALSELLNVVDRFNEIPRQCSHCKHHC